MNNTMEAQDLAHKIEMISLHIDQLPERDRGFAQGICDYYNKHGALSPKQSPYADKFFDKIQNPLIPQPNNSYIKTTRPPSRQSTSGALSIISALQTARKEKLIAWPRLRYYLLPSEVVACNFAKIIFKRAGDHSRSEGSCTIVGKKESVESDDTASFLLGRIELNGDLLLYPQASPAVIELLERIISGGLHSFVKNGKEVCSCCFCGISLTNFISIHHGYGPICADNYGLPWIGEKKEAGNEELAILELEDLK